MQNSDEDRRFRVAGKVKTIKGSILAPHNAGLRLVLSINNMAGKTDSNPQYPLFDKKWKKVKEEARGWYANKTGAYKLGAINSTAVQSDTWVLHMLAQDEKLQTDKEALSKCLKEVCKMAKSEKATVHVSTLLIDAVPDLQELLNSDLVQNGVSVYVYEENA